MSVDLSDQKSDLHYVVSVANQSKLLFKQFYELNLALVGRLIKEGCYDEATVNRNNRYELRCELKEFLSLVNALNSDCYFNLDSTSLCSSKIDTCTDDTTIIPKFQCSTPLNVSIVNEAEAPCSAASESPLVGKSDLSQSGVQLVNPNYVVSGSETAYNSAMVVQHLKSSSPLLNNIHSSSVPQSISSNPVPAASVMSAIPKVTFSVSRESVMTSVSSTSQAPSYHLPRDYLMPPQGQHLVTINPVSHPLPFLTSSVPGTIPTQYTVGSFPHVSAPATNSQFITVGSTSAAPYFTSLSHNPSHSSHNIPFTSSTRSSLPPYQPVQNIPFAPYTTNSNQSHHPVQNAPIPNQISANSSDATARHLLKLELFRKSPDPYTGEPHRFWSWTENLRNKIKDLQLEPWDIMNILLVNTAGKPQKLIETHMSIGGADPQLTLRNVWSSLQEQFGTGARIATSLTKKIDEFPAIKSIHQPEMLSELISICQLILVNMPTAHELQVYNLSIGMKTIWAKLAEPHQNSWRTFVADHRTNSGQHPPFGVFVDFLIRKSKEFSDPCYEKTFFPQPQPRSTSNRKPFERRTVLTSQVTQMNTPREESSVRVSSENICSIHPKGVHALKDCNAFKGLSFTEKRTTVMKSGRCFKCLGNHRQSDCQEDIKCHTCGMKHLTLMHRPWKPDFNHNNEFSVKKPFSRQESNLCTRVCKGESNINCSKVLLVDISHSSSSGRTLRCYCILDEQSTSSFIDPKVVEHFGLEFQNHNYTLTTLTGLQTRAKGVLATGFRVKGLNEKRSISLPDMFTNEHIPDCRHEVATPEIVRSHHTIAHFAKHFAARDNNAEVLILIGRDCGPAMSTKCFGYKAPFVHHTAIGWALVGSVCFESSAKQSPVTLKTNLISEHLSATRPFLNKPEDTFSAKSIFQELKDDELEGLSQSDQRFLTNVQNNLHVNDLGNLTLPLPFKSDNPSLPDNRLPVLRRTHNTLMRVSKKPHLLEECLKIMRKNLMAKHIEEISPAQLHTSEGQVWYIPVFPVQQKNKNKVRMVYDSSASYKGISLNDELLKGPDVNTQLRTVLLRFRQGSVAFTADVEAMFHAFHLPIEHRNFVRFFWWKDNDPKNDLVEYRATVHVFGNRSSPALANIGLRFAASNGSNSEVVKQFVGNNFYVDDALRSCDSPSEAISLLKETRAALDKFNFRLHKISSNSSEILHAFPDSEIAKSGNVVSIQSNSESYQTLGL